MKTIFIVNPKAGQGKNIKSLVSKIKDTSEKIGADVAVYTTKAIGDAETFVKDYIKNFGVARFIACGGDGTLGEVLNGVCENASCEIGVYPIGTGNDFCRNFKDAGGFTDIASQIKGTSVRCDAIKYKTEINGKGKSGYSMNMMNIGFDCNVVDLTNRMKKKLISGTLAYVLSVFGILIKKEGANLKIELDGEVRHEGKLLLTSIANGKYCGGGMKSNPHADIQDGLININIIKNVSRLKFLKLFPSYMNGTFVDIPNIEEIAISEKCKKVVITPLDGKIRLCGDGEIQDAGRTEFEIVHNAVNFVVPKLYNPITEKATV